MSEMDHFKKIYTSNIFLRIIVFWKFFQVFNICPLTFAEWGVVLKISLPVLIADEALKYIAREYIEKAENLKHKKQA